MEGGRESGGGADTSRSSERWMGEQEQLDSGKGSRAEREFGPREGEGGVGARGGIREDVKEHAE
eukprot:6176394-Pleurochrysis_carterae.AAC.2